MIDRIEKAGRIALWFALASACVILPVEYIRQRRLDSELKDAAKRAEEKAAAFEKSMDALKEKLEKKPQRMAASGMGAFMSSLSVGNAEARVWLGNVSPRSGVVCILGVAKNPATQRTTSSLPSCLDVAPYTTGIKMSLAFAGRELADVCPGNGPAGGCTLTVTDAANDQN